MKENPTTRFNTIEETIQDSRAGKVVIVVDDEDRENERDFVGHLILIDSAFGGHSTR